MGIKSILRNIGKFASNSSVEILLVIFVIGVMTAAATGLVNTEKPRASNETIDIFRIITTILSATMAGIFLKSVVNFGMSKFTRLDRSVKARIARENRKKDHKLSGDDDSKMKVEHTYLREIRTRLLQEIETNRFRGTLNLIIGVFTAIGGIGFICFFSFDKPSSVEAGALIAFYLPKSIFFIAVELLAYFFLRLYRDSISVARYYHNEITTFESKILGYSLADRKGAEAEKFRDTYIWLSTNDRNRTFSKEQTSWELEKTKIDHSGDLSKEDIVKIAEAVTTAVAKEKAKD